MARPRMHCALLLSLVAIASSQDVYLGEDLNVTMYDREHSIGIQNLSQCRPTRYWFAEVEPVMELCAM